MTPTWTGRPGEPVPAMLRHDVRVTRPPGDGIAIWTCEGCDAMALVPVGQEPENSSIGLCPTAVARRLAELEAHEASLHKYGAWVRRGIVRWLWAASAEALAMAPRSRRRSALRDHSVSLAGAADAIAHGDDVEWCEANPEPSPATKDPR